MRNVGLSFETQPARIDENVIQASLLADGVKPRDIADHLAEAKARKVSALYPDALVLGCDQVLDFNGSILGKPDSPRTLFTLLQNMCGKHHSLFSAIVICENGAPLWRHVEMVQMTMHDMSDVFLDDYIHRNWDSIRHAAGGYQIEQEGLRLFSRIEGDYFSVLGLPMIELLSYLTVRGVLER